MKARKILLWIVGVPLALYALAYAVLFRTTKPIEGVLVDARTGKPVSKALVHANWLFTYPNLVDTSSGGFGHGTVTDENGRFRIPRRNVTSVFRRFVDQGLMIKHPLYEFLEKQIYACRRTRSTAWGQSRAEWSNSRCRSVAGGQVLEAGGHRRFADESSATCGPDFYETMRDHIQYTIRHDEIMAHSKTTCDAIPGRRRQRTPTLIALS